MLPFEGAGGQPIDKDGWLYIEKNNRGQVCLRHDSCCARFFILTQS
eukprot:COSAG01_NODE_2471_length_7630_cov_3.056566_16_plen_46_part_00